MSKKSSQEDEGMVKLLIQLIGCAIIAAMSLAAYNISQKMDARSIDNIMTNFSWGCVVAILGLTLPLGFVAAVVFFGRARASNIERYGNDGWEPLPPPRQRRTHGLTARSRADRTLLGPGVPNYSAPPAGWEGAPSGQWPTPQHGNETIVTVLPPATPDDPEWE